MDLTALRDTEVSSLSLMEWNLYKTAHSTKSSEIYISPDKKFIKKTRKRNPLKRDQEFFNQAFWHILLRKYEENLGTEIYCPEPVYVKDNDFVMHFAFGEDLDRLTGTVEQASLDYFMNLLGQLLKIKANEGLKHGDFKSRHILVNGGLHIIDVETSECPTKRKQIAVEHKDLLRVLKDAYGRNIVEAVKEGFNTISPDISFFYNALNETEEKFGFRAGNFIRRH